MARRFRLIEHTADTGLIACGKTLAEAFANAAYGMFSIITDLRKVREVEFRMVKSSEADSERLLCEWLNNLIYLFDTEALLFKRFEIIEFGGRKLKAVCYGEKRDPLRHEMKIGIKSATYHMLSVD